mmetsp:Transcript_59632/g.158670  ORF Transcript_59632/g.158670 Transcript_59632/m.158670 type:complete len:247 (+) Transcript_59632:136-876(+)
MEPRHEAIWVVDLVSCDSSHKIAGIVRGRQLHHVPSVFGEVSQTRTNASCKCEAQQTAEFGGPSHAENDCWQLIPEMAAHQRADTPLPLHNRLCLEAELRFEVKVHTTGVCPQSFSQEHLVQCRIVNVRMALWMCCHPHARHAILLQESRLQDLQAFHQYACRSGHISSDDKHFLHTSLTERGQIDLHSSKGNKAARGQMRYRMHALLQETTAQCHSLVCSTVGKEGDVHRGASLQTINICEGLHA